MGIIESETKKASTGILAGILDALADWLDGLSPAHKAAKAEADAALADLRAAQAAGEARYAKLLAGYNSLQAQRTAELNAQAVAEKQAQLDAKRVVEAKADEEKAVDAIKQRPDNVLLRDDF